MNKITISKPIIVEGKYDKIKLSSFLDAVIIPVGGFSIYKDKETAALIRSLGEKNGVIILTDSDSAGLQLRNKLKEITRGCEVINVFIPEIKGKERRKSAPSKAGLLGVEGVSAKIILEAFEKAGVFLNSPRENKQPVTKADLFDLGLTGAENSAEKRKTLCRKLGLPAGLSANMLLEVVNVTLEKREFLEIAGTLSN